MNVFEDFGGGLHVEWGHAPLVPVESKAIFHMHPQYELLLVWEPTKNTTIINGKHLEIDHPMAVIAAPFAMHHTYFREAQATSVERLVLYFDDRFLDSFGAHKPPVSELLGNANAVILDVSGYEQRIRELATLLEDCRERVGAGIYGANETQSVLAAAIIRFLHHISVKDRTGVHVSERNYIIDVMEYIALNLSEDLTIPKIAEHFFISRDKLCRDFRRHVQMNVGDFISTARLNLAKKYLAEHETVLKEFFVSVIKEKGAFMIPRSTDFQHCYK